MDARPKTDKRATYETSQVSMNTCVCVCVCVCVLRRECVHACVCVCVFIRASRKERRRWNKKEFSLGTHTLSLSLSLFSKRYCCKAHLRIADNALDDVIVRVGAHRRGNTKEKVKERERKGKLNRQLRNLSLLFSLLLFLLCFLSPSPFADLPCR